MPAGENPHRAKTTPACKSQALLEEPLELCLELRRESLGEEIVDLNIIVRRTTAGLASPSLPSEKGHLGVSPKLNSNTALSKGGP